MNSDSRTLPHKRKRMICKVSRRYVTAGVLITTCTFLSGGRADAQVGESLLIPTVVPPGFDRGHNQSVVDLPRRDYDPVGVPLGSFKLSPSLTSGIGVTSNTFFTIDPTPSLFVSNSANAQLLSRWNRHELMFTASGGLRQFVGKSRRNEATWSTDIRGRLDLGRFTNVSIEEISSQRAENELTGETTPTFAALSRYRRDFVGSRVVNQVGRYRATLAIDYTSFRYLPLPLLAGGTQSQTNRDHQIMRATSQIEYAMSPDIAFFGQASYAGQQYNIPLGPDIPNLDSTASRFLFGINFDDPGFVRGSIGLGYTFEDFDAKRYKSVGGFSAEGRLEIFPSRLTTVTLLAQRTLEVTNIGASGAYWSNRLSARVDREVWKSILINGTIGVSRQSYVQGSLPADSYQLVAGARYLSSRRTSVDWSLSYNSRGASSTLLGNSFREVRSELALTYRI